MKKRRRIFFFFLMLSFLIPFILQRSIFPFYRFGMFAEPPQQSAFSEEFKVVVGENGTFKDFDAQSVGLYPSVFNQLLRNYYYRNEAKAFLETISTHATHEKQTFYFLRYSKKSVPVAFNETITKVDTIAYFKPIATAF